MGYQALLFCPDEKLISVVSQVFGELDFTVEAVHEPFTAVKKLMAQRYDALVVDSENEQNASLLFKSARNSSFNQGCLAIALCEGQMGVAKAYRMGANLVLTKPINVEQAKGTLRVARGLLRKSADAAAASAGTAPPAIPANTAPAAAAAESSFQPANPGAAATATPLSPPAGNELEAPLPAISAETMPAAVSGKIPTATTSAKVEDAPAMAPAPAAQPQITISSTPAPERRKSAYPATRAATSAPAPNASSALSPVLRSAAAPAPAKELPVPPAINNRIVEAEPAEPSQGPAHDDASIPAPTFSSGGSDAPTFAALGDQDSAGARTSNKTLIAAAAVLAIAAIGYLGYGYLVKSAPTSRPASAPQEPAIRPMSSPVEAPAKPTPDSASITTQPSTSFKTATAAGNPSTGATKSLVTHVAVNLAAGSATAAPNSELEAKKTDVAPMVVKLNAAPAKKQAQDEVSAPPPVVVASANDKNLSGLMSAASADIPQPAPVALKISQGVSQGLLIKRVTPQYPPAALRFHTQGAVEIEVTINKEGYVTNPKVLTGPAVLAQAALEAVRQWRYKPYYLDGAPVEIQTQITVNFKAN
ncbi:MAG: TonB family protein [Terriglobales bacterium]